MSSCFLILSGIAVAVLAGGCSSSTANNGGDAGVPAEGDGNDAAGAVGCTGGQTYSANMTAPGSLGVYTFTLVQSSPAPPAQYTNTWTLKVTNASGASPSLAQLTVYPFMPLMGHGSDQVPTVTASADGTFNVADVYLFMPGLWTVTISVVDVPDAGDDASAPALPPPTIDKAVYSFCID
jgi:YtkA-like